MENKKYLDNIVTEVDTLDTLAFKIIAHKKEIAKRFLLIGKELNKAKAICPHGEWDKWLDDKVEISKRTARVYMQLAKEYGENPKWQALADLGQTKLTYLLDLSVDERERFVNENNIFEMSSRELKNRIKSYHDDLSNVFSDTYADDPFLIDIDKLKPILDHKKYLGVRKGKQYISFLESIECGLIFPIWITKDNRIVDGHERVRAYKDLGYKTIPAYYVTLKQILAWKNLKVEDIILNAYLTFNKCQGQIILCRAWEEILYGDKKEALNLVKKFEELLKQTLNYTLTEAYIYEEPLKAICEEINKKLGEKNSNE